MLSVFLVATAEVPIPMMDDSLDDICILPRPDGGVTIMLFIKKAMKIGETVDQFIAREVAENGGGLKCRRMRKSQWGKLPDWPKDRKHRDRWRWDEVNKRVYIDYSLPKTKSEKLNDQYQILGSTQATKAERLDAFLEIEALKARP